MKRFIMKDYKGSPGKMGKNLVAPPSKKTPRTKDTQIRVVASEGTVDKNPPRSGKRIY